MWAWYWEMWVGSCATPLALLSIVLLQFQAICHSYGRWFDVFVIHVPHLSLVLQSKIMNSLDYKYSINLTNQSNELAWCLGIHVPHLSLGIQFKIIKSLVYYCLPKKSHWIMTIQLIQQIQHNRFIGLCPHLSLVTQSKTTNSLDNDYSTSNKSKRINSLDYENSTNPTNGSNKLALAHRKKVGKLRNLLDSAIFLSLYAVCCAWFGA